MILGEGHNTLPKLTYSYPQVNYRYPIVILSIRTNREELIVSNL